MAEQIKKQKKSAVPEKLFTEVVKNGKSSIFVNVKQKSGSVYVSFTEQKTLKSGKKDYKTINVKTDTLSYLLTVIKKAQKEVAKVLKAKKKK